MKIADITCAQPTALPDCIVIARPVESRREPSASTPSGGADFEQYMPMPTPPPNWPRVFPGL
jgi:hypothetical protein